MGDETNVVARYGGEEMIIAVPNTTRDKLAKLAETVRRAIESQSINLIKINTQLILEKPITLSVGAVIWGKEDQGVDVSKDSDILINRADEALYQAKANGRNQVVMYSPKI
jgi:diguanylate cyclase